MLASSAPIKDVAVRPPVLSLRATIYLASSLPSISSDPRDHRARKAAMLGFYCACRWGFASGVQYRPAT